MTAARAAWETLPDVDQPRMREGAHRHRAAPLQRRAADRLSDAGRRDSGPCMDRDRRGLWRPAGHGEAWTARRVGTCACALAAALLLGAAAPAQTGRVAYVIDGDTFRLASGERIRVAGIDAPETQRRQAKCAREIAAGRAATALARGLLMGRTVRVARLGRSYNRTVARVTLDGRDVGTRLVQAGAARWWPRGEGKPDWCRR